MLKYTLRPPHAPLHFTANMHPNMQKQTTLDTLNGKSVHVAVHMPPRSTLVPLGCKLKPQLSSQKKGPKMLQLTSPGSHFGNVPDLQALL